MGFKFEVLSGNIVNEDGYDKKHVKYTILVKSPTDMEPIVLHRRYTDFLELYRSLQRDNLPLPNDLTFPRKVFFGNFDSSVILARRASFETLLSAIWENEKLRESSGLKIFLVGKEERDGIKLLRGGGYDLAKPKLLNSFLLLNKIYTERHPSVIKALCRLVACCNADPSASARSEAAKYGEMAIRR